jgi:predicted TIM-barrel fold metal-dependent hydrolase
VVRLLTYGWPPDFLIEYERLRDAVEAAREFRDAERALDHGGVAIPFAQLRAANDARETLFTALDALDEA